MNKKVGILVGSLVVAGVVGFGVYQSSADSNVMFQPSEPAQSEQFEGTETTVASNESKATNNEANTKEIAPEVNFSELSREEVREQLLAEYPGVVTQFEVDRERGKWIYEVEIKGEDTEYELDVNAETGEVVKMEQERDRGKAYAAIVDANLISMEEAENIARNEFSGVIKEVQIDHDDGRWMYEIEMKEEQVEAEFDIDATTGEIIELEYDDED
jgi:uncharacterized membrane protein YkoI